MNPRPLHRTRRIILWGLLLVVAAPFFLTLLTRFVRPPITPLMLIRLSQGEGLDQRWRPLPEIAPDLMRAVIGAEDATFCVHHGFDWHAIDHAVRRYQSGGPVLGASTISMQTAKNVFLWPGRDFLRKGLEAGFTLLIETLWGKRRILEVYLNVAEWGHGIYGAEAAAQSYFHKPAATLTRSEAAALAAILPNPRHWSALHPTRGVAARIAIIRARLGRVSLNSGRCSNITP